MKKTIRSLSLALAAVMLLGSTVLMSSCRNNGGSEASGTADAAVTTESNEPVALSLGGSGIYRIVRPSNPTDRTLEGFKSLIHYFNTDLGAGMEVADDWLMPGTDAAPLKEILVGNVDRAECRELYPDVPFDGYAIRSVGNKIIIAAHNDDTLAEAIAAFKTMVEKKENGDIMLVTVSARKDGAGKFLFGGDVKLEDYRIVYASGGSDKNAKLLAYKIKSAYGVDLSVVNDNEAPGDCEFVIGITNRSKAGDLGGMNGVYSKFGYRFTVRDKRIYITCGDDAEAEKTAVEEFINMYVTPKLSPVFNLSADLSVDGLGGMKGDTGLIEGADTRIMSFNILSEEWDPAAVMTGRDYRVAATILNFSPDVAGIQEISEKWYSRLTSLIGSEYDFVGKKIPSGQYNYTGLIYNKNRIRVVDSGMTVYSVGNSPRLRLLNWGVFESIGSGKRFIVCNTHYDANHTGDHTPIRIKQATEMAELVNGLVEKYKLPVFCCGDYNCNEESEPFNTFMTLTGFKDPKYTAKKIDNQKKTTHKLGEPVTNNTKLGIDHITCSPDTEILYYNTLIGSFWDNVSDHCPIYIEFRLNK